VVITFPAMTINQNGSQGHGAAASAAAAAAAAAMNKKSAASNSLLGFNETINMLLIKR